jgi:hypothetical protein
MVEKFTSHLKVDKQIVSLLSKSTYQKSFSNALRELVSNSYDADALTVNINIMPEYIEIYDDGNGMTKTEFEKYLTIAGSKNESLLSRRYKRKKIGQFGVGFLSIFPFCESLEITTTAENSTDLLSARIPTQNFFQLEKTEKVEDIPIHGNITKVNEKSAHYTRIRLITPTFLVHQYFSKPATNKRDSIITWNPMQRFKWELQEDLPISYNYEGANFNDNIFYDETIGISVFLNKEQLFRNDLAQSTLSKGMIEIDGIECSYIFKTNYKSLKPLEARGVKLRVNNVGIGPRTDFFLKRDRGFSRLHWIDGEVQISEKIKEYLNISREGFISNPKIESIQDYFAERLTKLAYDVENISEAEKQLEAVFNDSPKEAVKPKDDIIKENLLKLEKRGFTIIEERNAAPTTTTTTNSPNWAYKIDKENKTITVNNNSGKNTDTIQVFNQIFEIEYTTWDFKITDFPACRFKPNSLIIEVNQSYPLFKSKSQGGIFVRFNIMLLVAHHNTADSNSMYHNIVDDFIKEFRDYI